MVSFTSLIVLATVGFSAVSAAAIPKRDLDTDITNISAVLDQLDTDVNSLDPQDPNGAMLTMTADFVALVNTLSTAAIQEEGQPQLQDDQIPDFMNLLNDLDTVLGDIEHQVPIIQAIDGLVAIMESGLDKTESVTAAYINSVIALISGELKPKAVEALYSILATFETVEGALSTPPPSSSSA